MSMSSSDQQVWKKVLAAKNKSMTLDQIMTSFPSMGRKGVMQSAGNLVKLRLFTTRTDNGDKATTVFVAQTADEAKQKSAMTPEQKIVLQVINAAGERGIASAAIGRQIGNETIPQALLRKAVKNLESSGLIKTFKPVNAPTTVYYVMANVKIPEEISGGIWFDNSQEYDQGLVDALCHVLRDRVQKLTYADVKKRSDKEKKLIPNVLSISTKNHSLLTPIALKNYVNALKVASVELSIKNVMEIMRALELDGDVEAVKPYGSISFDEEPTFSDDDDGPSSSKRKRTKLELDIGDDEDDIDEEERERRKELALRKAKEKAREKKRRDRQKEKEKEAKEKKRKKEEKKRREKEKKKRKKEKEKEKEKAKKKKSKKIVDSDSDEGSLLDINEEGKSKSKSKKHKRSRSSSVSSVSSSASSSSASSSSSSSSVSSSGSASSVSSVGSDEIDSAQFPIKSKSQANGSLPQMNFFPGGLGGGITDLTDTSIIYRATNRSLNNSGTGTGQTQISCGKCPVFSFCEDDGPVNPNGCEYLTKYLNDDIGGWDKEILTKMRPDLHENDDENAIEGIDKNETNGINGNGHLERIHDDLENGFNGEADEQDYNMDDI
ncbi:uncharacterized protein IL334_005859 [Kwoniella shivajii]|uniref:DNA-directed RNA polymerase III subunit RPC6 n=1 Tax=Kwoniella shivajii TaxID=564305 RepID=A0ABZ1D4Z5_9TREE|nr:hypothetical protein IL334_005859 [Kwoniella shivajii]